MVCHEDYRLLRGGAELRRGSRLEVDYLRAKYSKEVIQFPGLRRNDAVTH